MNSLIDDRAILDDEEDDESFDEETGEPTRASNGVKGRFDDSSEEDEDDDDEEAQKAIAEGFIVDEDEDEEEAEARRERRREKRKRRREEREDEGLDEEDLELIGLKPAEEAPEPKFKRLKRGPREDDDRPTGGINDIFRDSDEEDEAADARRRARLDRRGAQDEFDDFIEEDVFSDEEQQQQREDAEVARPKRRGLPDLGLADAAGLDEQAMEDFREAFGDGTDYDFALEREDEADYEAADRDKHLELKDVFEPSQLAERMLTDEDVEIRNLDEPERHQIARKPYRHVELTEEQFKEEAQWISNLMLPKRRLPSQHHEPFRRAVAQTLEFLVHDNYEVPFIFQHRKDYLILIINQQQQIMERLLGQNELWEVFENDLKFRALIEKRQSLQKTYDDLKSTNIAPDTMFEDLLPRAITMEELQDLQDYIYFQYASQMKDLTLTGNGETNGTGMSRKKANTQTLFEQIRAGKVYGLVRSFGITADDFAKNALNEGVRAYAEDPVDSPENLADSFIDEEFPTSSRALRAAKAMFIEELVMSPRFRKYMRMQVYTTCVIDCVRTEKGLRKIDEQHPFYEFKYLRNQDLPAIANRPEVYLKMLKAQEEGLVEVKVRMPNQDLIKKQLYKHIVTDNSSTVADAWNSERREIVASSLDKLLAIMGRYLKEQVKSECESRIAADCRADFLNKIDQAPYKPRGMKKGTVARILTMSNGGGIHGRDAICWTFVSDDGRVVENGKFTDLASGDSERNIPDGKDVEAFVDLVRRREPEVIGVSGWSPEARKLSQNVEKIVQSRGLSGPTFNDDDDRERSEPLDVIMVNDEVARLYQNSDRAREEHPSLPPLTLYCVALARYMQNPIKEYASLGRDIVSISFHPAQNLLPQEKLIKSLETALIDIVNLVGVDPEEAANDPKVATLLTYVCGLGPRKAQHVIKTINMNGNRVATRESLLGLNVSHAALGPKVWSNAASFLHIDWDQTEEDAEFLDSTRIHPEDYDIARKMAADALELDEEDIEAETREFGPGAIVRRLIKEDAQDRVNDLEVEEYAIQLEKNLNVKKRAILQMILEEITGPYEELRSAFAENLSESELFTMLTGETRDSLQKGMTVPMQIKRVSDSSLEGKLDCGLDAHVMDGEGTDTSSSLKQLFAVHQTIPAHVLSIDRRNFTVSVSLREEMVKRPFRRFDKSDRQYDEWDDRQEAADRKNLEQKTESGGRVTRVIKHPLFRPFNSKQAEEYLGSQNRGDVVIRPSSKGTDHLAVTWKVADGVFQHIDVLELDKENEFSLGRTLRVGGKYTYSDLDELIVMHVKAMARKVDEMMNNEKFQDKPFTGIKEWLETYTNANPKRSMYQFCVNRDRPGYFHLCFKAGQKANFQDWSVKVIPQGFELMKQPYPTMRDLCNGFKLIFGNMSNAAAAMRTARR